MDLDRNKDLICISAEDLEKSLTEVIEKMTGEQSYEVSVSSLVFKRSEGGKQQIRMIAKVGEKHSVSGW
ncbi:hypothetical protein [Microbulbifer sp. JMSA008]|jgi:hypothetical protein|uniref:hypothetical protein n=1 Tax=unclassified Microbulbifer TaxID=2619833 RepID=UPI00403AA278